MKQYWVVGAMWGGTDDVLKQFVRRSYWYCWDIGEEPDSTNTTGNSVATQRERFRQIKRGDCLAVKRMLGQGAQEMEVRALGVVRDVDFEEWRVYVRWVTRKSFKRAVPLHGCTASVHGPFPAGDPWVHEVFCI
ncbi:MAG: hypothetical protein ACRDHZ_19625 [Ktedonobacteraceae bacterium]